MASGTPKNTPPPLFTKRSQDQIDWNDLKKDAKFFQRRFAHALLANEWLSDMTFFLESESISIPAHSLIVGTASPVLERYVFGGGAIGKANCVDVPAYCAVSEFQLFLRYLYTGEIENITLDTAIVLIQLAVYYDMDELEKMCMKCINKNLTEETVCKIYMQLHHLGNAVTDNCVQIIRSNSRVLLSNGSLWRMHYDPLKKILNNMCIESECELFSTLIVYGNGQCLAQNSKPTPELRRKLLEERLFLVRFGSMSPDEFVWCIAFAGRNFFTHKEISDILQHIALELHLFFKE